MKMLRRTFLAISLLCWAGAASGGTVVDATGRGIEVPDHITRVLPAGPSAPMLLAAIAPDLMVGWTSPVSDSVRAMLSPEAAKLPQVSRLTGRVDVTEKIVALNPDLILDYGTVAPRYIDLAKATQQRTGIPTVLLSGSLADVPHVFRRLGSVLHREDRGETLARFTEALLAVPKKPDASLRIVCARGPAGLTLVAPEPDLAESVTRAGWHLVASPGRGPSRQVSLDDIRAINPNVIVFTDPAMRATLTQSEAWRSLRAVRDGHAFVAPNIPFGWLDDPPSINRLLGNRLLGIAWLGGAEPRTLAALFNAVVYGRALTTAELQSLVAGMPKVVP
jgi:iron complex transport system substrate-binding protein